MSACNQPVRENVEGGHREENAHDIGDIVGMQPTGEIERGRMPL